jgi:hypothetical protein
MKLFTKNCDYIISQSLDYGSIKFVTSEQNFADLMTQHRIEEVCSVNNIRSSDLQLSLEKPSAMSIKFLGQHAFTITHVAISMDFHRRQVLKNQEKRQIIKKLTIKRKVKHHFMKHDDYVLEGDK